MRKDQAEQLRMQVQSFEQRKRHSILVLTEYEEDRSHTLKRLTEHFEQEGIEVNANAETDVGGICLYTNAESNLDAEFDFCLLLCRDDVLSIKHAYSSLKQLTSKKVNPHSSYLIFMSEKESNVSRKAVYNLIEASGRFLNYELTYLGIVTAERQDALHQFVRVTKKAKQNGERWML